MSYRSKLYNVEIIQFWRGNKGPYRHYPLHWVIYVETDPGIGNTYQIVGDPDNYTIDVKLNQPHENPDERVQIMHDLPRWNSQDWVASALISLKCSGFFGITSEDGLLELENKMCWLLEGGPWVQDTVEFIGGDDLACVIANRHFKRTHELVWKTPEYGHMRKWLKQSVRGACRDFHDGVSEVTAYFREEGYHA